MAAAEFVLAAQREASVREGAVATVGRIEVRPGSTNSIPGWAGLSLDARALDVATLDGLVDILRTQARDADFTRETRNDGAAFDAELRTLLHGAAGRRGIAAGDLPSYAGHDAGILAPHVPAAMVFVRNPTGHSHNPQEYAAPEDCAAAAEVLADALEAELQRS